jgi:hypothetical protein
VTEPVPGGVTAPQVKVTVPPAAGVAALIVGAVSFATAAEAVPVPSLEK